MNTNKRLGPTYQCLGLTKSIIDSCDTAWTLIGQCQNCIDPNW